MNIDRYFDRLFFWLTERWVQTIDQNHAESRTEAIGGERYRFANDQGPDLFFDRIGVTTASGAAFSWRDLDFTPEPYPNLRDVQSAKKNAGQNWTFVMRSEAGAETLQLPFWFGDALYDFSSLTTRSP